MTSNDSSVVRCRQKSGITIGLVIGCLLSVLVFQFVGVAMTEMQHSISSECLFTVRESFETEYPSYGFMVNIFIFLEDVVDSYGDTVTDEVTRIGRFLITIRWVSIVLALGFFFMVVNSKTGNKILRPWLVGLKIATVIACVALTVYYSWLFAHPLLLTPNVME